MYRCRLNNLAKVTVNYKNSDKTPTCTLFKKKKNKTSEVDDNL